MTRALELAREGLGYTCPNPMVGAVIVKHGRIIGEGYHRRVGGPHAEIEALQNCTENPRGAAMYVTLEPCHHFGRTPPCTQAVLKAGIEKVSIAMRDPNPQAKGGVNALQEAGVTVEVGLLEDEAIRLNPIFLGSLRADRPHVSLKLALTLNGMIARRDGTSRWITGPHAREWVHRLRAAHSAILVGVDTVLSDNPQLNSRNFDLSRSPVPVVLDTKGRVPATARVFVNPRVIYLGPKRWDLPSSVEVYACEEQDRTKAWSALFERLKELNLNSLFVEGGASIATSLIEHGYVDYTFLFYGPCLFPLDGRVGMVSTREWRLESIQTRVFEDGVLMEGKLQCLPES